MRIGSIQGFDTIFSLNKVKEKTYIDPFESFFNKAIGLLNDTDEIQKDTEKKQVDFIIGKSDDIIGLSMAQSRANSAIQFTAQVTNKVLNAYQEVMRIPI